MSKKTAEKTHARLLQRNYNCKYQTAINLIRRHGLDGAIEHLEQWKESHPDSEETDNDR